MCPKLIVAFLELDGHLELDGLGPKLNCMWCCLQDESYGMPFVLKKCSAAAAAAEEEDDVYVMPEY
jgi:hypothetical protein